MLWTVFLGAVKLLIVGAVILYAGMAIIILQSEGTQYRVRRNWRDPARTVETFLVWAGVRIASLTLRLLRAILDLLEEASADVGEWILHHR
ncbi:MAG TPA: hypothetical protein VFZ27_13430 [Terriglobia bacterium]|nr:hypothetical protein [Terriglobia bacterium]